MNPHYKECQKIVGDKSNNRFHIGENVFHWFAGNGRVEGLKGKSSVKVKWRDGSRGEAWAKHLRKI